MAKKRAAGYIRVSTSSQVEKTSLSDQEKAIKKYVKEKGWEQGKIYADKGISGAHTEGREGLIELLRDSENKLFDSVVVDSLDRFGRNLKEQLINADSLKDNSVDLIFLVDRVTYGTDDDLVTQMRGAIAESERKRIARRTMRGRISAAKDKNIPSAGRLPYARTYDKEKNEWGIDTEQHEKIKEAATRFLNNETMEGISDMVGLEPAHIYKTFRNCLGDKWTIEFNSKLFPHMSQKVTLKVPRLLPDEVIKKIHEKTEMGQAFYHHKDRKKYLLRKMVYCGHCNYAMTGATIKGIEYYKHLQKSGKKSVHCGHFSYIKMDLLEANVVADIYHMLGDAKAIEKAVKDSIVGIKEVKGLKAKLEKTAKILNGLDKAKQRVVKAIAKGIIDDADAKIEMDSIRSRQRALNEDMAKIQNQIGNIPDDIEIKGRAKDLKLQMKKSYLKTYAHFKDMSKDKEQIRELLVSLFDGKDSDGKKMGVYIERKKDRWIYTIKGKLPEIVGTIKNGNNLNVQGLCFYNIQI